MLKIRRLRDRRFHYMVIPILIKRHFYIETAPGFGHTPHKIAHAVIIVSMNGALVILHIPFVNRTVLRGQTTNNTWLHILNGKMEIRTTEMMNKPPDKSTTLVTEECMRQKSRAPLVPTPWIRNNAKINNISF